MSYFLFRARRKMLKNKRRFKLARDTMWQDTTLHNAKLVLDANHASDTEHVPDAKHAPDTEHTPDAKEHDDYVYGKLASEYKSDMTHYMKWHVITLS